MKLMRYKSLFEKTFKIGKDVDYIYDTYYNVLIGLIERKGKIYRDFYYALAQGKNITADVFSSASLKSQDCKKAHNIKPINIYIGLYKDTSPHYDPLDSRIILTPNYGALYAYVVMADMDDANVDYNLGKRKSQLLKNEISSNNMKGTIYHELSHWLNDALHNLHMTKKTNIAYNISKNISDENADKFMRGKWATKDIGFEEIDAQIHSIKQMKRAYKKQWDSFTLEDVFMRDPSLMNIGKEVSKLSKKDFMAWQRNLIERMVREKLWGKNMRQFLKPSDLIESIRNIREGKFTW